MNNQEKYLSLKHFTTTFKRNKNSNDNITTKDLTAEEAIYIVAQ